MPTSAADARVRAPRLFVPLLAFVAIGVPLVAVVWETLNRAFAGHVEPTGLAIGAAAAALLAALLVTLARLIRRWDGADVPFPHATDPADAHARRA